MNRPIQTESGSDEALARILEVAEEHFRRVGYHRRSVVDIASELGMSPANIYRFSRDAINESICGRVLDEVTDIVVAIARTNAPAIEKLDRLPTVVHRRIKMTVVKQRHMHKFDSRRHAGGLADHQGACRADGDDLRGNHTRRGGAGEFDVDDAARAVRSAFTPFFHSMLIERCVQHGDDTEAGLRDQIRFVLKALGEAS